ncbi:MAG: ribosome-associated translation inhibitor RaiA [Dehalococcoidales bacterium]|nr:ribosome-associated translation inhibitor RaiA [Dehalococcoidales bacterium]
MELQIAGINTEITPEARQYIERKLGKMKRYLNSVMDAKIELTEEQTKSPDNRYLVRVTANSKGSVFHGEERGVDLFTAIDKVAAVMTRQLEQHKERMVKRRRHATSPRTIIAQENPAEAPKRNIVKTKHFVMDPMSISEAINQMETLGHNFFLFLDTDSGRLRLVYKRNDGNYGLIIPEME